MNFASLKVVQIAIISYKSYFSLECKYQVKFVFILYYIMTIFFAQFLQLPLKLFDANIF